MQSTLPCNRKNTHPRGHRLASVAPLIVAAVALSALTGPRAAAAENDPALESIVDPLVAEALAENGAPAVSVAILEDGKLRFAKGYGLAEVENGVPATERTVYRIGSITKQFTAAAVLKLVEQKKVALDDPLEKWVTGFGAPGNKVTVRHLLWHTSGIKSYTDLGKEWADVIRQDLDPDAMMDLVRKKPLDFETGTRFRYDNSGYFLLGMVIEKAAGKSYADFIEQDLLAGLGLPDTRFGFEDRIIERRAQGYSKQGVELRNDEPLSMLQPYAAGSLVSTVVDLVRFGDLLASGRVVSQESYAAMIEPGKVANGKGTGYGFGLRIADLEGRRLIEHGGGIHGFGSQLSHYPDAKLFIAVLYNGDFVKPSELEQKIARAVMKIETAEVKDLEISEDELDRCAGVYLSTEMKCVVRIEGEKLVCAPEGQSAFRLLSQGDLLFRASFDSQVTLQFDATASPAKGFVLKQNGATLEFERKS